VMVDPHDNGEVGAVGRSGNDDFFRARFEVLRGGIALGEDAGAFECDVDPQLPPRQPGRIALGRDADLAATGIHPVLARGDLAAKAAVHTVVAQQVRIGLDRPEIVDANDFELFVGMLQGRAHYQSTDAAKAVDRNPYRHGSSSRSSWLIY